MPPTSPLPAAASRPEILLGAVIYLMSAYRRKACPRVAHIIASHLQCLAEHPEVDRVIRDICAGMTVKWNDAAGTAALSSKAQCH